ncbi:MULTISPECIES: hypothetical protein [unclassified Streptomyces]|uniref:hypothetical protein n=1 Tax=unclassified Streptomyces TaxID=2593676 RepID=UPI0033B32D67
MWKKKLWPRRSFTPEFKAELRRRDAVLPRPARAALPIVGTGVNSAQKVETQPAPEDSLLTRSRASTSARVLRARERWLLGEAPCASCPWLHQCSGTCPARALINNGSLFSIDDLECSTRLALFPRILADVSLLGSRLRQYHDFAKQRAGAALAAAAAPPR